MNRDSISDTFEITSDIFMPRTMNRLLILRFCFSEVLRLFGGLWMGLKLFPSSIKLRSTQLLKIDFFSCCIVSFGEKCDVHTKWPMIYEKSSPFRVTLLNWVTSSGGFKSGHLDEPPCIYCVSVIEQLQFITISQRWIKQSMWTCFCSLTFSSYSRSGQLPTVLECCYAMWLHGLTIYITISTFVF